MKKKINNSFIERFSRQIVLKKVGISGQKLIDKSKILIVGAGGLGCPVAIHSSYCLFTLLVCAHTDPTSLSHPF